MNREDLFDWNELKIDKVANMIQQEPWRTKEILEFISDEMRKEVEFKEELDKLKKEYHHKKRELYQEYWYHYLDE